jgi:hypothetical protein
LEFESINALYTTDEASGEVGGEIDFGKFNYWKSDPQGVTSTERIEFASIRELGVD